MNHLKFLEFSRLIKELQFVESDFLYRQEMLNQANTFFLDSVNRILIDYPELGKLWIEKSENVEVVQTETTQDQDDKLEITTEDSIIKKLYRDIVKATHPDKIKNQKLNELYLEATSAYDTGDAVTIYKVCADLMIQVDFEDDILEKIKSKIQDYKNQINFLESTFTSQWIKSNDTDKNKIILKYIENKIN